ncbi:MAG: glycosyl transferase family 90 [Pseudomonadota bacterium]
MLLRKENGRITAVLSKLAKLHVIRFYSSRIATHAHWFAQTSETVREISTDLSDGHAPTGATYRFSTTPQIGVPVPDPYFFASRGYQSMHAYSRNSAPNWNDRDDDVVWRGALNNMGLFSLDPAHVGHAGVMQRLRMAQVCRTLDIDFRFAHGPGNPNYKLLNKAGLTGDRHAPESWGHKKFAIDIDGFSNAWNNFMQRLALGCCVLKVDSPYGFYQWYYHKLQPWEHFIPIKADLSDVAEQLDWAKTHIKEAREIATAGQAVVRGMTLESETQVAAEIIERHEAAA